MQQFADDFGSSLSSAYDIWGYASPSGREYAIIALSGATAFVDVTNPICPVIVEQIAGEALDVKTLGTYALVVSDHTALGLQVIDMSLIDSGVVTLAATANPGGFTTAHNIAVNEDSNFAYIVLTDLNSGFTAIDLSEPLNPVAVGDWTEGWVHDMQVVSYSSGPYAGREVAFVCGGSGINWFTIVDVTDKNNIFTRGAVAYPNASTPHQGWLSEDRRYFFFGDEGDESRFDLPTTTYVFDVQDLDNPILHTTFTNNLCSIDHNQIVRGSRVYQGNYTSGLRVYDIADVNNIKEVGYFDTYPFSNERGNFGFSGAWGAYPLLPSGIILVSDISRGLFVLKECEGIDCGPSPPCCPLIDPPQIPASASHADQPKARSLSIVPNNPGMQTALQVTLTGSTTFPNDVGKKWWVAPPVEACENSTQGPSTPLSDCGPAPGLPKKTMWSSSLTCTQTCLDWSALIDGNGNALDVLHISDADISSGSFYEIRAVNCSCFKSVPNDSFSEPLVYQTSQWGDLSGGLPADCPRTVPDNSVDLILDCVAILNKFANDSCAMLKSRADIEPHIPDQRINITDVLQCVNAFSGLPYPFPAPVGCP
jgi:choice-of-anchor B domain-containing protein